MVQISSGLRSILSNPIVYNSLQWLLRAPKAHEEFIREYLRVKEGFRILDIGCGPADILDHLPESVTYVGYDASEDYIHAAQERYAGRNAQFFAKYVTDMDIGSFEPFDLVLAKGLLHHLDDEEAERLFELAKKFLRPGGRVVTFDCCYLKDQRLLAKLIISYDRGQNTRMPVEYRSLAEKYFPNVSVHIRHDLLRIPYDHIILECHG